MARITSSVGLVSGIDTSAIISALLGEQTAQVTQVQNQENQVTAQKEAYTSIATQLQGIQTIAQKLQLPDTFGASTATSSNQNVLTATASTEAAVGTYQFQVAQLVSSQQSVSTGYASSSALIGAGTVTVEMGGGNLNNQTTLAQLNGGAGVSAGSFRITDASGASDIINTSQDITLDDVVKQINTAPDISVKASIQNNHLVLTDASGGTSGQLTVADVGGGSTAADLRIAGSAASGTQAITGTNVNYLSASTALGALNDGLGVRKVGVASSTASGPDFSVTLGDGSVVNVALGDSQTVGDAINAINTAGAGKLTAAINAAGAGLTLTDKSGGGGTMSVTQLNGSDAASDLGILQTGASGAIDGRTLIAGLDSVLVSSLNGGKGIDLGKVSFTDRTGKSMTVDLTGAQSVQDILDDINNAAGSGGVGVSASLNSGADGIQIADTTDGSGNLVVANADGADAATALGIAGSFNTGQPIDNGGNLQLQWINENTSLSSYNGGQGVSPGSFTITNAAGKSATVNTASGTFNTLGDVIAAIDDTNIGVTASIDGNGNGLLLTDSTTGTGKLTVANVNGTTATDLNIAGMSTATDGKTIDGSFEKTISLNAADTLQTVQGKIQALNFGVSASIINDGSANSPYRLSLTALNSGSAGRFVFDAGNSNLQTSNLVQAQDAAVFVGGSGAAQPLLITSTTNQLTSVIPGVTVNLVSASDTPTTLTVARDPSAISTQITNFVNTFNQVATTINTLTNYDTTTNTAGLLLGDPTILDVQTQMYSVLNSAVDDAGQYHTLEDLGVTVGSNGQLAFDQDTFNAAYASNPTAVANLFSESGTGLATVLNNAMTTLVDPVSGVIPIQENALGDETLQFQQQITELNQIIQEQQNTYETEFANMELTLANLQDQQEALGSLSSSSSTAKTSTPTATASPSPSPTSTSSSGTSSSYSPSSTSSSYSPSSTSSSYSPSSTSSSGSSGSSGTTSSGYSSS